MLEIATLAKYPFLNDSRIYVKKNALFVEELLDDPLYERARATGIERLDNSFKYLDVGNRSLATESDCIMELLSYPIARMAVVCIDDLYFKRRYALSEAIHAYKNLINESTSFLIDISKEFKLNVKFKKDTKKLSIFFTDYLHNAPTRYKEWKMINRDVENGYVHISHKDLARLIQESLRFRINNELDIRKCNRGIFNKLSSEINRIKKKIKINTLLIPRHLKISKTHSFPIIKIS